MTTLVKRSALLPYAAAAMFDIVNDIGRYAEFLPFCSETRVIEQTASFARELLG